MGIVLLTLAALLVNCCDISEAFTVRTPVGVSPLQFQSVSPYQRLHPLKFTDASGGVQELNEIIENKEATHLERHISKAPSVWKIAGYASVPVSAALGFHLVPSRRLSAHAVGAIITGVAGAIGKSRLDALTESTAPPAIAKVIVDNGLKNPTATASFVKDVQQKFGIADDGRFESMCTDVYKRYLLGMVKFSPTPKTSEIKELGDLKTALGLSNMLIGEAHAAAADEWFRTITRETSEEDLEDPDHVDRQAMDKFLFLTERALGQAGETMEAFTYEMTRIAKAMRLSLPDALERVADMQEPFYRRALKSTRAKLGENKVSRSTLELARKTLGISNHTAHDLNIACFNEEIRDLLGVKRGHDEELDVDVDEVDESSASKQAAFPVGAKDRLIELQEILALTDDDAEYEISQEAGPLFQSTSYAAMKHVLAGTSTPEDAWKLIETRRDELLIPTAEVKERVSSLVMQALGGPLEETNKFAKVNNDAAVYDNLLEALEAKETLITILKLSGWNEYDDFNAAFCDPWDPQSANGFLRPEERMKLYRTFLVRSIRKSEDGKISDEQHGLINEVKGILGLTDEQAEDEVRAAFGPEVSKLCLRATVEIVEDYTAELAKNMHHDIDDAMESYRLSDDFLRELAVTYYGKAVGQISEKCPSGIPSTELNEALHSLQQMFRLEKEDTYPSHMEYFGAVYKKSILEAMGSTGVIRPEYREALTDLRDKLGVREKDSKKIALQAMEEKLVPMVQWISSELERTMLNQKQLAERRGRDIGEDVFQSGKVADGVLGLGADANIMGEMINLVDFYTENEISEETQVGVKEVEGEEVPVFEASYPITGLGANALDQQTAELLYRQFVVGAFSAQGEQATRYENARTALGGIIGLTSEKMEDINDNIGSTVYDNFVSRSMTSKGTLDQQDMMFLANIQGKLGLTPEQGEKMLVQSQRKVLSEQINVLMDDPNPAGLRAFREKCNSMGMDLSEDVGISTHRLVRMFESEIIPALKSGEISVDNSDLLTEVQESLSFDPEECESSFETVLLRLAKQAVGFIQGELLRGRDENAISSIKELVRYAAFVEGDLGLTVEEATAYQIFNMYEAFDFSGDETEQVERNKELLRIALGIS